MAALNLGAVASSYLGSAGLFSFVSELSFMAIQLVEPANKLCYVAS